MTPETQPKRFYKTATVEKLDGAYAVLLDGRGVKTPDRKPLTAPTHAVADLIAKEWNDQGDTIDHVSMPATRYANLILDRAPGARDGMAEELVRYGQTDLLCHLADHPSSLRMRQEAVWAPIRAWADETYGVRLEPVEGVIATAQPPASLLALKAVATGLDDWRLTLATASAPIFSSALLAVALDAGRLSADQAFNASILDETFQAEQWGWDEEAEARLSQLRDEIGLIARIRGALDQP